LRPKDPFKQQYTGPASAAAEAASSSEVAASSSPSAEAEAGSASSGGGAPSESAPAEFTPPESTPTSSSPEGSAPSEPVQRSGGAGSGTTGGKPKYASDSIDVRIVAVHPGGEAATTSATKSAKPEVRRGAPELTMLPSRATPVAVFMGTSSDGKKALLLVSS